MEFQASSTIKTAAHLEPVTLGSFAVYSATIAPREFVQAHDAAPVDRSTVMAQV